MLDAAAYCPRRLKLPAGGRKKAENDLELEFRRQIDKWEAEAHSEIAKAFGFTDDQLATACTVGGGKPVWRESLWIKSRLVWASAVMGAVAAGTTGAVVDLFVGGASFFLGAVIGGTTGFVAGAVGARFYKTKYCEATGTLELRSSDPTLTLLLGRAIALTDDIQRRGDAKEHPEQVPTNPPELNREHLGQVLEVLAETRRAFQSLARIGKKKRETGN